MVEPVRRPPREDSLAAELKLIERADRALREGDAGAAAQALNEHRSRYRRGQLARERDQLSVLADCLLDKPGARERAQQLVRTPSLLGARVAKACHLEREP